jgi:hypothetical protein
MTQIFTVALTDEEAGELRELAAYWDYSLEEAMHRVVMDGLDIEMQLKAIGAGRNMAPPDEPATGPGGDLDDGIPF